MSKQKSSGLSNGCRYMEKYLTFEDLPKEIVAEIMFRLPPESLIRLKSLNKSWYFLIRCLVRDPEFMAKHQHHAEQYPTLLLVIDPPLSHCRKIQPEMKTEPSKLRRQHLRSALITRLVDNGNLHCITENIDVSHLPIVLTRERRSLFKVYHCNGVVCFDITDSMKIFTLYSPVMGKFETFQPKPIRGCGNFRGCVTGFGSDPLGNNFKVLRILDSTRAHIFAPGTSNSWREIKIHSKEAIPRNSAYYHVYLKGYCFWIVTNLAYRVLCFDVCKEAIREILLPIKLNAFRSISSLTTVGDSVCLFSTPFEEPIEAWVLDISTFSWRKWLRIEHFKELRYPLTFWGSDELLMETVKHELVSYNIRTQKLRSVSPQGMLGDVLFYLGVYVKSLASAKWFL